MSTLRLIANTARALAAALVLASPIPGPAIAGEAGPAADPAAAVQPALDERIDAWVRRGYDHPDEALAALQTLDAAEAAPPAVRRALLQARGIVLAQSGRDSEAATWVAALQAHAQTHRDPQADAAASLVLALAAQTAGRLDLAAPLAQSTLDTLHVACPSMPDAAGAPAPGGTRDAARRCDYRSAWQALQLMQQYASRKGLLVDATAQARAARDLAGWAGDAYRLTVSSAELAWLTARSDSLEAAHPLLRQAQRLAERSGDPVLQVRVKMAEARIASQRGELDAMRRLAEEALPLARSAESPRLEASLLSFLSDAYVRLKRPAEALRAAERGLPIARRHNDLRTERVLTNNAGLAKIGLHRIAEGKQDLARVEALARSAGLAAQHAQVLREYDDALTAAGDWRGALDLYHRERALNAKIMSENREAALKQLQLRNDRERKQRDIELAARDNQLKSAALTSRGLMLRVWMVAAAVLALAAAAAVLLYRRVRETNRRLVASQAQLLVQSERDPLTHLANRRHFLSVMQAEQARGGSESGFDGALLLVDIDHFKHVNDGHGHAAGDVVLCEVARRLSKVVRGDDLVVRWGGEEFLVLALKAPASHAEQMAARVLRVIGDTPVMVQGLPVSVTVSIGYARFPLPPNVLPVAWEQAINLADMALYTAKSQGRNRAVGIVAAQAPAATELRRIEADFDRAWHDGRITLAVAPGPVALA